MMWSSAVLCFVSMFVSLALHVKSVEQRKPYHLKRCLNVPDDLLEWFKGCKIKKSSRLDCVTAIKCPKECKDQSGHIHKLNDEWAETKSGVTFDCECKRPTTWLFPSPEELPQTLYKKLPPQAICKRRGCARSGGLHMNYDDTYYEEHGGKRYKCTCVNGPDPLMMDDASHSHIKCEVVHVVRCISIRETLLTWFKGCVIERAMSETPCVTAISNCPRTCKDGRGQTHQWNEEWVETRGVAKFDCECNHPVTWVFPSPDDLPPGLIEKIPPSANCKRRGCARSGGLHMNYNDTYYEERDGKIYRCTCVNRPDPLLMDDAPHSHIKCEALNRCILIRESLLTWFKGCTIERATPESACVTAITNCPKTCKDINGLTHQWNKEWVETRGVAKFDCECNHPVTWVFPSPDDLPPGLIEKIPPSANCKRRGCARSGGLHMDYNETYLEERGGERYKCTCINRPDPLMMDDATHSHVKCQVV